MGKYNTYILEQVLMNRKLLIAFGKLLCYHIMEILVYFKIYCTVFPRIMIINWLEDNNFSEE